MDRLEQMILKDGILVVMLSRNDGPLLSTAQSPSDLIMNVGAIDPLEVTKDEIPPIIWTSRGPTFNGGMGVAISGPSCAMTSTPKWPPHNGTPSKLAHGTSISSPIVCGCMALLLSSLKQKQLFYSPISVRRAVENTGLKMADYDLHAHGNEVGS